MQVDEMQRGLSFVSISADGDVLLWTLAKCELLPERLIRLQPTAAAAHTGGLAAAAAGPAAVAAAGGAASSAVAAVSELLPQQQADGGLCMDFGKVGAALVCRGGCVCCPRCLVICHGALQQWLEPGSWHARVSSSSRSSLCLCGDPLPPT